MENRMAKRITAIVLALIMMFGMTGERAYAAELTEDSMTTVLLAVKRKLVIGDEFTQFSYHYYQASDGGSWNFYWYTEDYSRSISATCDQDAHITYYYTGNAEQGRIPEYTRDELLPHVMEELERITPEISGHIRYQSASYQYYQNGYQYRFVREENGIDMPDDSVTASMNATTGELYSLSVNWDYGVSIPQADIRISKSEATEKIGTAVNMELFYRSGWDANGERNIFLAYTPDRTYVSVDAMTGELYTERTYWSYDTDAKRMDDAVNEATSESGAGVRLSEAELKEIDKLKDIISASEAVQRITAMGYYLQIDERLNYVESTLYASGDAYRWSISMRDARPYSDDEDDHYRASLSASVDAKTGEILSFYASNRSYYEMTDEEIDAYRVSYNEEQCRQRFEEFAMRMNAERFAATELSSSADGFLFAYNKDWTKHLYGGYSLVYTRVNEGVRFNENYVNGAVSAMTGKIYSYSTNWTENVSFKSPKDAITPTEALDAYLSYDGYDLVYELVNTVVASSDTYKTTDVKSVRLVYRTQISPYYVDAFTGKQLNYAGGEYSKAALEYAYTDIAGTKYERAIRLLADMGIGIETEKFEPDRAITSDEFSELLSKCRNIRLAEEDKPEGTLGITRLMVAKTVIRAMGYDEIAQFQIYTTGYSDEDSIDKVNRGYVALAKGFGLMGAASGKKFKPLATVSRGEAADIILKLIGKM